MIRECKAVKLVKQGFLTDERSDPIICPIRKTNCTLKCAWFSIEAKSFRCRDIVIGAVRPGPVRSFRLCTGPDVYDLDELLVRYDVDDGGHTLDEPTMSSAAAKSPCTTEAE
jgi:hypothetical protein